MRTEAQIISGLMARGVPLHVAQGIVANMIAESRLRTDINEAAPLVPGSRGGFGLNQWTGPRRRALEAAAQERGVPVNDLDFQLDYTMEELQGPERRAWTALQGASNAEEAARIYSERFLRPGIPHLQNRLAHARRIAGMGNPPAGPVGTGNTANAMPAMTEPPAPPPQAPQNAMAGLTNDQPEYRSPIQMAELDPRAFEARMMPVQPTEYRPHYLTRPRR